MFVLSSTNSDVGLVKHHPIPTKSMVEFPFGCVSKGLKNVPLSVTEAFLQKHKPVSHKTCKSPNSSVSV